MKTQRGSSTKQYVLNHLLVENLVLSNRRVILARRHTGRGSITPDVLKSFCFRCYNISMVHLCHSIKDNGVRFDSSKFSKMFLRFLIHYSAVKEWICIHKCIYTCMLPPSPCTYPFWPGNPRTWLFQKLNVHTGSKTVRICAASQNPVDSYGKPKSRILELLLLKCWKECI